jgi:sacsin
MGSVAACLRNTNDHASIDHGTFPTLDGLAFCFLPLPVKTNLPVHVNAYFELSSNRRDIWRGDDTTGESKVRGEWNTRLMEDVLAPLYVLLLTKLAHQLKKSQTQQQQQLQLNPSPLHLRESKSGIYSLIPSLTTSSPWEIVRHTVLTQIKEIELLWSNLNGGCYLPVGKAIILPDARMLSNSTNEILESAEAMDRIEEILLLEKIPLAVVPPALFK